MGIKKLLWRAFPVLPLVYDDTLSFYEVISKITNAVNQLIDNVDGLEEAISRLEGTVTSVNGVTADADGNVELTPADVGAKPASYTAPVDSVNGKIGAVELDAVELGGVTKVNGVSPDNTGNVVLPTISAVSSVNNVLPDSNGNVQLSASNVGAKPASYEAPVSSVNNKTGDVQLSASDVGAAPAEQGVPSGGTAGQFLMQSANGPVWSDADVFKAGDTVSFNRFTSNAMSTNASQIGFEITLHKKIPSGLNVRINNPTITGIRGNGADVTLGYNNYNSVIILDDHTLYLIFDHVNGQVTGSALHVYSATVSGKAEFY